MHSSQIFKFCQILVKPNIFNSVTTHSHNACHCLQMCKVNVRRRVASLVSCSMYSSTTSTTRSSCASNLGSASSRDIGAVRRISRCCSSLVHAKCADHEEVRGRSRSGGVFELQQRRRLSSQAPTSSAQSSIILFPGQGTQYVGMGRALLDEPIVQDMFRTASDVLKFDLQEACLNGPDTFLSRTQVQQPAILVCSLAALHKLQADNPAAIEKCVATAGFSVGEITALTFAGAFSFEDAVRLIKVRSEAMQEASEQTAGGLATVFTGRDSELDACVEAAKDFCRSSNVVAAECKVANHLGPNCKVVGGSKEALQFISDKMANFKLKRVKCINVSGAFHTEHMRPAADALEEVLRDMLIRTPRISVHANIDGKPYSDVDQIRRYLPRQIYSSVLWEQTLRILYEGKSEEQFPRTFECGPGQSLKAILKMVNDKALANAYNVEA